jgi:hypothetical protein
LNQTGEGLGDDLGDGIRVTEQRAPGAALEQLTVGVVAFVGRTLRGPVNRPVAVRSFSEFERQFGGLWQPASLPYAVAQFFGNGGSEALVVRVANAARPATLALPVDTDGMDEAGAPHPSFWSLAALQPGTREYLRAAVDYDGLGPDETDEFNLLVQRVRAPGSEVVEAQEYYPRASALRGTPRYLEDLLASSALVSCHQACPGRRPLCTPVRQWRFTRPDGDDGLALSDHDLIGSPETRTGLFALAESSFQWLVLPPRARELPVGLTTWWVAARFCAERRAMLLVDPPEEWRSLTEAWTGLATWSLRNSSAAMWFPWIEAPDPLRGGSARFPPSGALAGLLSRHESQNLPWHEASMALALPPLRAEYRLSLPISPAARARLGALGVNVPSVVRVPRGQCPPQVTLAAPASRSPYAVRLLHQRRLQALGEALLQGTRWVLFLAETDGNVVWRQVARQVSEWLASSTGREAGPDAGWFVVCDRRLNPTGAPSRVLQFLFGLADPATGIWHAFLVRHGPEGSEIGPATANSWALAPRQSGELRAGGGTVSGGFAPPGVPPAGGEVDVRPRPDVAMLTADNGILTIQAAK